MFAAVNRVCDTWHWEYREISIFRSTTRIVFAALIAWIASSADAQRPPNKLDNGKQNNTGNLSPAGLTMTSVFSPTRAPKQKTMGLLQRSFLDLADQGSMPLQVAVVVDGTDSMATELAGVRSSIQQMIDDLERVRGNEVSVSVVVYRDAGSPSGEYELLLKGFTSDKKAIAEAVQRLQPETGAPFFHELPDLGIYHAIETLPWSSNDQVAKWILMFGDAPPYAAAFSDKANRAYRRFATPLLVGMATKKNIRINCVLCTSSDNVAGPYDTSLLETRAFMNSLSGGTDGLMLDLSYPDIRTAIARAGQQPDIGLTKIKPIQAIDIAAVQRSKREEVAESVRVAVLPHLPIDKMSFDPTIRAVQVSTAVRNQLAKVNGVRVSSHRDIRDQVRRLRASNLPPKQALRVLAARLNVDFVIWGTLADNAASVTTATYQRDSAQPMAVPISLDPTSPDLAMVLINASASNTPDNQAITQLVNRMEQARESVLEPLSRSQTVNQELLVAMESLEQALAFESGDAQSSDLLDQADLQCSNALTAEPRNPVAHWLRSSIAYNQASALFRDGEQESAEQKLGIVRDALTQALQFRDQVKTPSIVTEIEADYYLLVARNTKKAVASYQTMTKFDQPQSSQLRGHWMLAGIHAGDWGTGELAQGDLGIGNAKKSQVGDEPGSIDPDTARFHIIEILANFPESPEARLLKQWLRWDPSSAETKFNHVPRFNQSLLGTSAT